jgi:hypothetical protein
MGVLLPRRSARAALVALCAAVVLGGLGGVVAVDVVAVPAAGAATTTPTTSPNQYGPGLTAISGTLRGPGISGTRKLNAEQAAEFMRSWLAYSVFGKPPIESPPPDAPLYHITVLQEFRGDRLTIKAMYAEKNGAAWVGMPAQNLGFGFVDSTKWIGAQALTIATFRAISGGLVPHADGSVTVSTAPHSSSSSSSSSWPKILLAIVILVAVAAIVLVFAVRTGRSRSTKAHDRAPSGAKAVRSPATASRKS